MDGVPLVELPPTEAVPARHASCIRDALQALGFVRIAGHGVSSQRVRECHAAFAAFFGLPEERKRRCGGCAGGQRGFTSFGVEHARDQGVPDLKEFFHVGQSLPADHALAKAYPANVWPAELPELEPVARELFRELERCARRILGALAESFGLPADRFAGLVDAGNSVLRAVHYPAMAPADRARQPPGALRAAPHEDIDLITLLCGATEPGLEIESRGSWWPVDHDPEEIVVDTGDMLARLTNGVLPATTHRVVEPGDAHARARIALPFFAHPRPECDLTARAPFVSAARPRALPPITAGRYLSERLREIGLVR